MNNTVLTLPTNNQFFLGLPYTNGTGLNISTATPAACGPVPAMAPLSEGTSFASAYGNELNTLLADSVNLQLYAEETNWIRKQFVFNELMNNLNLNAFSGLNGFKANNLTGNIGKLKQVEERIEHGNYLAAKAINNTINPKNVPEQNQKSINTYILEKLIDPLYIYSASEQNDIYAIAGQCPLEGGQAVYQARNMAMLMELDYIDFVDNCSAAKREMQSEQTATEKIGSEFKLYPNPNNGNMNLIYTMETSSQGQFIVYDITGKVINTYVLQQGVKNQLFINETVLNNGVYFYKVIIDGILKASDKLIIIR
jgi:hypothetical protein